jgi:hypothetical protein
MPLAEVYFSNNSGENAFTIEARGAAGPLTASEFSKPHADEEEPAPSADPEKQPPPR